MEVVYARTNLFFAASIPPTAAVTLSSSALERTKYQIIVENPKKKKDDVDGKE